MLDKNQQNKTHTLGKSNETTELSEDELRQPTGGRDAQTITPPKPDKVPDLPNR